MDDQPKVLDLNTLGIEVKLDEDQLVMDAILVIRSSMPGGTTRYTTVVTTGMDYATARGLVGIAHDHVVEGDVIYSSSDPDNPEEPA